MAGRKRNYTAATPEVYEGKLYRTLRGVYIDPEVAKRIANLQAGNWRVGFGKYKTVKDAVRPILQDTGVQPYEYAPYYAVAQIYFKKTRIQRRDKDVVRTGLSGEFPTLRDDVLTQIFDMIDGLVIEEVQTPARRGE